MRMQTQDRHAGKGTDTGETDTQGGAHRHTGRSTDSGEDRHTGRHRTDMQGGAQTQEGQTHGEGHAQTMSVYTPVSVCLSPPCLYTTHY